MTAYPRTEAAAPGPAPAVVGRIPGELAAVLIEDCVALARATRDHRSVRQGSTIRGAMDVAATTAVLLAAAGVRDAGADAGRRDPGYADAVLRAMLATLPHHVDVATGVPAAAVLREVWADRFGPRPAPPRTCTPGRRAARRP